MSSRDVVGQHVGGPAGLFGGLSWSLWASILGTLFLRSASFATGALLGLVLGQLERYGLVEQGIVQGLKVGLLGAAYFVIEVAGAPAFGLLVDRRGFRTFLALGPLAGAISVLVEGATAANALAVAEQRLTAPVLAALSGPAMLMPLLFVARAFHGLSAAVSIPATLAFLSAQTGDDAARRSRAMAFFEVATIVGIGVGVSIAGRLWDAVGGWSFVAAVALYVVSLLCFVSAGRGIASAASQGVSGRQGGVALSDAGVAVPGAPNVSAPQQPAPGGRRGSGHLSLPELARFLTRPRMLRFAPSWIAVNAIVGLWIFYLPLTLTGTDEPSQFLMGGFSGQTVSNVYLGVGTAFLVGIVAWGYFLGRWAPTSVMQAGLGGLYALIGILFALNHAADQARLVQVVLAAAGLLTLAITAAFTPAALTYLAMLAEERAERRGATMGLYSVFLGVGQGTGTLLGGPFYYWLGADGLIALTFLLALGATVGVQLLRVWERTGVEAQHELAKGEGAI